MAKDKFFIWVGPSCDWSGGRLILETGKQYEAALIEADVLAEWVRTGSAKMAKAEEK